MEFIANQDVEVIVSQKRQGAIDAQASTYGANVEYAGALNLKFEFDWFELQHNDSSDEGKAVRKEKTLFFDGLKEIQKAPRHMIGDRGYYENFMVGCNAGLSELRR